MQLCSWVSWGGWRFRGLAGQGNGFHIFNHAFVCGSFSSHAISLTFTSVAIMASEYLTALDGAYTTLHSLPDSKSLQALSPELMLQQAQLVISDLDSLSWIQIVLCTTVVYCLQLVRKRIHQIIYHIDYFHDHMLKSDCSGCRGPWGPYALPRDLFCI